MWKKALIIIFSGITVFGLLMLIIGFSMGGRPGSFTVEDRHLVYRSGSNTFQLWEYSGWPYRSPENRGSISAPTAPTAPTAPAAPQAPTLAGDLHTLKVDVSAGHVKVVTGAEYNLDVDGSLEYTSTMENGEWKIEAIHPNILAGSGRYRFFLNNIDVTTTFTITVPQQMQAIDIELDAGVLSLDGVTAADFDLEMSMGEMTLNNCNATVSDLDNNMGSIRAEGFYGQECTLTTSMGGIYFDGEVTNEMEIDCSMGEVTAKVPRPAQYSWDVEVGLGHVSLDGRNYSGLSISNSSDGSDNNDIQPHFGLKCSMGSITVSFQD